MTYATTFRVKSSTMILNQGDTVSLAQMFEKCFHRSESLGYMSHRISQIQKAIHSFTEVVGSESIFRTKWLVALSSGNKNPLKTSPERLSRPDLLPLA